MKLIDHPHAPADLRFLAGDGEMAARIRAHDWAANPLGPPQHWPQSLKVAIRIALTTRHPVFIFWGPDQICLYNDAYAQLMGPEKHPAMLGLPGPRAWAELWDVIAPQIDLVMKGEGATWHENQLLVIPRHGVLQETFWTYSYSPIDHDTGDGRVGGVIVLLTETTAPIVTARRMSRAAERLLGLFDHAPGFMCILQGPDHRFEVTNRAFDALVAGRARIGTPVRDALPETVGQGFVALLDTVYRSGEPHVDRDRRIDFVDALDSASRTRHVDFIFQPIRDDHGRITGIFCQGDDVTELHTARQSLRASESRFRGMADNAPVMLWVTDPQGNCIWLNARWYEYTGQTEAEALGLGWTRAVHPEESAMAGEVFLAASTARVPFRIEYRLRGIDGSYRWALDCAMPRFSDHGSFLGFVGSVVDIDDRHAAEERLRTSEARFRAAVAALQGVLWTNSPDGRMTGEQPGWSALTGQSETEYRDFGWSTVVHRDDAQPTIDAWNAAVAGKHPFVFEHRVRRHDGSWGNYAVRAIPIIEAGTIAEWVGINTDITEQRHAEAELRALNATLEDRIAAELRHRAEIEAVLRQAQKMEAIGHLTSGLAHDFNNMLTVVISSLHILDRTIDPEAARSRRYLDTALDGATRAAGLVDRLMAFSRQQPLALASTDINAVIAGMADMLAQAVTDRITLEIDLDPGLPPLLSDAGLVESAVLNLAVNARDAMPAGGTLRIATATIEIDPAAATRAAMTSGSYARISVTDTGTGMTPEVIERAFNPFFTTKDVGKGTGLGLSQVHGFARQCGGSVTIASTPGEGTEVRILLPLNA